MLSPTNSSLRAISSDYQRAEITCIVAEERKSKTFLHLFTMIELVPSDQLDSPPVGDTQHPYNLRQNVDDDYTLYVIRIPSLPVDEMITLYEQAQKGVSIKYKDVNNKQVEFLALLPYILEQNPSDFHSQLIQPKEEKTIGNLLPYRRTHCRVWTQINTDKTWLTKFSNTFFDALSKLSKSSIGFDLYEAPEHIGNIYLFAANPIIRHWEKSLPDREKQLLVSFYERQGKTVKGCKLILEEIRSDNKGFYFERVITSTRQKIELPYFPDILVIHMLDPEGRLIDYSHGAWLNFSLNMAVQDKLVNYSLDTDDGTLFFSVPKRINDTSVNIGNYDLTVARYLKDARHQRRYQELEKTKEFVFFPKEENSVKKAKKVVHDILNRAKKRCMILDPYFSAKDLVYVFHIENVSVPIQIISSSAFLKQSKKISLTFWQKIRTYLTAFKGKRQAASSLSYAEQLLRSIEDYQTLYPVQKIECRVLPGSPSPLHDRYLVVDDDVYLLGSSLNEFGNRTTTLIKVPAPAPMIEQALEWWNSCPDIQAFCQSKNNRP